MGACIRVSSDRGAVLASALQESNEHDDSGTTTSRRFIFVLSCTRYGTEVCQSAANMLN